MKTRRGTKRDGSLRPGYVFVRCPGEAHSPEVGGMIDHCGVCAPNWGRVAVPVADRAQWALRNLQSAGYDEVVRLTTAKINATVQS